MPKTSTTSTTYNKTSNEQKFHILEGTVRKEEDPLLCLPPPLFSAPIISRSSALQSFNTLACWLHQNNWPRGHRVTHAQQHKKSSSLHQRESNASMFRLFSSPCPIRVLLVTQKDPRQRVTLQGITAATQWMETKRNETSCMRPPFCFLVCPTRPVVSRLSDPEPLSG